MEDLANDSCATDRTQNQHATNLVPLKAFAVEAIAKFASLSVEFEFNLELEGTLDHPVFPILCVQYTHTALLDSP